MSKATRRRTLEDYIKGKPGERQHTLDTTTQVDLVRITVAQVGRALKEAFDGWLDANKDRIDPRLYAKLKKQLGRARITSIPAIMGLALWMFGVVNDMGCRMTLGPHGYRIAGCDGYDGNTTERLVAMIHTALQLQALAPALASQDNTSPVSEPRDRPRGEVAEEVRA
jgi:hypothetical protein